MTETSTLQSLEKIPNIYVATKGALRTTAIVLKDRGVCLVSPVAGLTKQIEQDLKHIGPLSIILAPNHYHNKALAEYAKVFPEVKLCSSDTARPRLEKVTELSFETLNDLTQLLPDHLTLIEPEGLKTGEVWVRSAFEDRISWFVVDAFCGEKMPAEKDWGETVSLLKTFPTYGVKDPVMYSDWLRRQLKNDQPTLLIPCHGKIIASQSLPNDIETIMSQF